MKIVIFGGFTKRKHGISRVVQELARSLLLQKEIDALTIVTPHDEDFVDPSIVMDERVSVHPLVAFEGFLNFSQQLDALKENFLKIIQLYKRNDIFLLCSLPSGRAFARIPVGGILLGTNFKQMGLFAESKDRSSTLRLYPVFVP